MLNPENSPSLTFPRKPYANGRAMLHKRFPATGVRALLIDIDDTIICNSTVPRGVKMPDAASMLGVLRAAAARFTDLSPREVERRIEHITTTERWWHWSDFIVDLGLPAKEFWDFAFEVESRYLCASGPDIGSALERLHAAGIKLYVASNNPSSGILHKLRLAGIAHVNGTNLFDQLLGATELRAMKWEARYWKKALAHTGLSGDEIAVVGDSLRDDYEVPHSVGIARTFLLDHVVDRSAESTGSLIYIRSFSEMADLVLGTGK